MKSILMPRAKARASQHEGPRGGRFQLVFDKTKKMYKKVYIKTRCSKVTSSLPNTEAQPPVTGGHPVAEPQLGTPK